MRVVVLGAGISGLSVAYFLKKKMGPALKVDILEQSNRIGGWIESGVIDDYFFEFGPRGCHPRGEAGSLFIDLAFELGLEKELIVASPSAKKRFVWKSGRLHKVSLLSPFILKAIPGLFLELFKKKGESKDQSVEEFFIRRFGPYITNELVDPMISGIYAGCPSELSMRQCFPSLLSYEQNAGSVLKGFFTQKKKSEETSLTKKSFAKAAVLSFRGGMETLPRSLGKYLDENLHLNTSAISIEKKGVETTKGFYPADVVISTLPLSAFSKCVNLPGMSSLSNALPMASLVLASVGFSKRVLNQKGFGYLISSLESKDLLGMVWDSETFPVHNSHSDQTRLTLMMGGARNPELIHENEADLKQKVLKYLNRHLGISQLPDLLNFKQINRAIPQFPVGFQRKKTVALNELEKSFPNVFPLGACFSGVSVSDCIKNSFDFVSKFDHLQKK